MLRTDEVDTIEPNAAYQYDHFNQLNRVDTEGKTSTYKYNGDGLRYEKTVDVVTTKHIYDGSNIVMELDGTGKVKAKYIRGPNLIYSVVNTGNRRYYLYNGHGDVEQLTDANGNVIKEYKYDAFGNELEPDTNDTNLFRYAGKYQDLSSGVIYLRARYYDPSVGCFISEDPIRDGENWYVYANSNPIRYSDPSGLSIWLIHGTNLNNDPRPQDTWTPEFREYISEQINNESVIARQWSGGNDKASREAAAEDLANTIICWSEQYPDDLIRLVAHSHGGNVAILTVNKLAKKDIKVETLVTVATPGTEIPIR